MDFSETIDGIVELKGNFSLRGKPVKSIKVLPRPKHAEIFSVTAKPNVNAEEMKKVTEIFREMIKEANPNGKDETVEIFIQENYGKMLTKLAPLFGFHSIPELDKKKETL